MNNTNGSPKEWIKVIGLVAIVFVVTTAILLLLRTGMQPGAPETEPASASETPQPYPPPATEAVVDLSAYPPPQPTPGNFDTDIPEPTQELVLIGTDEWGEPTTPVPTRGPAKVITYEPGLIDAVIPLAPPAVDAQGMLIYFARANEKSDILAQGINLDAKALPLSAPTLATQSIKYSDWWLYPAPNGSHFAINIGTEGGSLTLFYSSDVSMGDDLLLEWMLPVDDFYAWHPDNQNVLFGNGSNLLMGNVETGDFVLLVDTVGTMGSVGFGTLSPDGQRYIYFDRHTNEVWSVNINGLDAKIIYSNKAIDFSWSSDGKKVAFYGNGGVTIMDPDGSNLRQAANPDQVRSLYHPQCYFSPPIWSPDSKMLAVVVDTGHGTAFCKGWSEDVFKDTNIYLIDVASGISRPLLPDGILGNIDLAWSPDGRYLAFVSNRSGAPEIWVAAVDGSELRQLTDAGKYVRFPFWRRP
jgi:WD40 repeat protein